MAHVREPLATSRVPGPYRVGRACRRAAAAAAVAAALGLSGCSAGAPTPSVAGTPASPQSPAAAPAPTLAATPAVPSAASPPCSNTRVLANWSVQRLAEQVVIVPVQENSVGSASAEVVAGVGGVVLFGNSAPTNLGQSLRRLRELAPAGIAPMVMVDEEGGSVQRMANLVGMLPAARQMGATLNPAQITRIGALLGQRLRALGVNVDLAPVLDADGRPGPTDQNPIGSRSFSADPAIARTDGLAFAQGLESSGVLPVIKHFPGLGGATGNSDLGPSSTLPWPSLERSGLLPFAAAAAAGVPALMIANASVPGLTTLPASISPAVITGILRGQLDFRGLVVTDSMSAVALRRSGYSVPAASAAAIRAGADMILFNASSTSMPALAQQTVLSLVAAVERGTVDRSRLIDAVTHILTSKNIDLCAG